jgi:hypothetical protein
MGINILVLFSPLNSEQLGVPSINSIFVEASSQDVFVG